MVADASRNRLEFLPPEADFRFPCGHVEPAASIAPRVRSTETVAWVGCRRCNVVALAFAAATRRSGRRRAAR